MLASAQGWSEAEKALQLPASLQGSAVEVLGYLPPPQCASYVRVAESLQRRFGHHHQAEVYRARLMKRTRERGVTLSQLAQDVEALVRTSYPAAPEEMIVVLARDFFADAVQDQQLQIYIKQAHPGDLQMALARALEFEAFLETTSCLRAAAQPRRDLRGRKTKVEKKAASRKASPDGFHGSCWGCGEKGHRRSRCPRERRTHSLDRLGSDTFQLPARTVAMLATARAPAPSQTTWCRQETRTGWRRGPNTSRPQSPGPDLRKLPADNQHVEGSVNGKPCRPTVDTGVRRPWCGLTYWSRDNSQTRHRGCAASRGTVCSLRGQWRFVSAWAPRWNGCRCTSPTWTSRVCWASTT
ncbi:uncharacterized protein LOC126991077 [Eriocheir sinensis]|uniref:uncharacterized protein LOC126991077 n=1 Tax=Eriocheir sinensis TaxID=95602 RepID=UPI0021C993E2|nr:uncharacterized protein LOC126991077 [Eriocheir sinensis]